MENVQSLENKLDKLRSRLSYQRDLKNCNILRFSDSELNKDRKTMHRQDRAAALGKVKGQGCVFVNNS
jgi:hypothetical protein